MCQGRGMSAETEAINTRGDQWCKCPFLVFYDWVITHHPTVQKIWEYLAVSQRIVSKTRNADTQTLLVLSNSMCCDPAGKANTAILCPLYVSLSPLLWGFFKCQRSNCPWPLSTLSTLTDHLKLSHKHLSGPSCLQLSWTVTTCSHASSSQDLLPVLSFDLSLR